MSEGGFALDILFFESLPSTQTYLIDQIRQGRLNAPVAVRAAYQTEGIGSRGNRWENDAGDLLCSIALPLDDLPADLPMQSASIYVGWLMRETLHEAGEDVWLKWPNDLYLGPHKIGGVISQKLRDVLVTGIGVNLQKSKKNYHALKSPLSPVILLNMFLKRLEAYPEWKDIFSHFEIEFEQSRAFATHRNDRLIDLQNACLQADGSIEINGERIHSLR